MPPTIEPELQLLARALACEPAGLPPAGALTDSGRPIDWDRFEHLVERHRVSALVAQRVADLGATNDLAARLALQEAKNAIDGLRAQSVIRQLAPALRTAQIRWVVLKGLVLAQGYYPRAALREMIDVDVLVDAERIGDAEAILRDQGFERYHPRYALNAAQRSNFMALHSAFSFIRKRDGAQLDLHWRTVQNPRFLPRIDAAWQELIAPDADPDFPVLREDIHFTYVLVHGAKHGWVRLKWLADIERMLRTLDQQRAGALAQSLRANAVEEMAGAAFLLCQTLFGTTIPGPLLQCSQSGSAMRLHDHALTLIGADIPVGGVGLRDLAYLRTRVRHSLGLSCNRGYRREAMLREFARPADLETVRLPAGTGALLALISPILALGRTLRGAL